MSGPLTVSDVSDGGWQEFEKGGTVYYKYKYKTKDGEEFIICTFVEDAPEGVREQLYWLPSKMSNILQALVIDISRELEK